MPMPRTPIGKAQLTGVIKQHPERFRDRAEPDGLHPVGPAPKYLSAKGKKHWADFVGRWPWLTSADEPHLAALCQLRCDVEDPKVPKTASLYQAYRVMIGDCGGTPTSRSKIAAPKQEEPDDPFAKFGTPH